MAKLAAMAGAAAGVGLVAGGCMYAAMWPTSQIFGRTLIAGDDPDELALTFDDGPNDAATPQLLDVLARHGVRATFFMVGDSVRRQPELARRVLAEGHVVGNHTMHHPRLAFQSAGRIRAELRDASAAIEDATGVAVRLFRPPFGARRPAVLRIARELGLVPVMWNADGRDWLPHGAARTLELLEQGIAANRRRGRGSNLLLHDGSHLGMSADRMETVAAVDRLLRVRTGGAMRFVTVDSLEPAAGAGDAGGIGAVGGT
jgi:peptidoglycan/xylan/chitin deacetylase (PgdA/CDA1 family)